MNRPKNVSKQVAEQVFRVFVSEMEKRLHMAPGTLPTGKHAAHRGDGPELVMDWNPGTESGPRPTILIEGGVGYAMPGEYGIGDLDLGLTVNRILRERGIKAMTEAYASYAVSIWPE